MSIFEQTRIESTLAITMNNGKNTQDLTFASELNLMLEEIQKDDTVHALVLSSSDEKNWSQGINLEWMGGAGPDNTKEFFVQLDLVYSKLMLLPVPTIAAITGHAFGAGAFLATACDYRFMNAEKGFFCFPEININMDFLPGVFHMLMHKLPDFKLPDLLYTGKYATATELEKCFIVEKACQGVEDTKKLALEFGGSFQKDRTLIASYKQKLHGAAAEKMVKMNQEYLKEQK